MDHLQLLPLILWETNTLFRPCLAVLERTEHEHKHEGETVSNYVSDTVDNILLVRYWGRQKLITRSRGYFVLRVLMP